MHKTTIFIIQLCVVFELFIVKVVKRHFRLNFVTSRWVQANNFYRFPFDEAYYSLLSRLWKVTAV